MLLLFLSQGLLAGTVSPLDANLRYGGRWDTSNRAQPWCQAQGSSITIGFTGSSLGATLNVSGGEYFRVVLDGDHENSTKHSFTSGLSLSLVSGLTAGAHVVELVKETDVGRATLHSFEIDDGETSVPPPPPLSRRIIFYGDSNLAGYSLESERNQGGSHLVGCHFGYAGITARMFAANYQNISRSGATISSLNARYDRVDWNSNSPSWNFSQEPADVVVANIGANDAFQPKAVNKARYHDLLDDLRASHPAAHIMLFNAYGWDDDEPANYTHEVIAERGDPQMSSAVFPWVFEQYHGCQTDHAGMAVVLAAHLSSVMGWVAGEPDVMSGYGVGPEPANGSFEHVAPFGGWGWRYFDDPGVSRVIDAAEAREGSAYLRLTNGASSHQTNPAGEGELVAVALWMRADNPGDTVDVSLSFRDQNGGGEVNAPLAQTTETMTLSSSWQRFTLSATAPTGGANPIYSARVSFTAGNGTAVDIDDVGSNPWTDLGGGSPGFAGVPSLVADGPLVADTTTTMRLSNTPPSTLTLAWISFNPSPFPALGGAVHAFPYASQLFVPTSPAGTWTGVTTWPSGIASSTEVWFQFLVSDLSSVHEITLSNGLLATVP